MKRFDSHESCVGFTIIELLVVIGILGILLAALLPMVGSSRDSALTAKCANNMKNLALAVISYAQAHGEEGWFPAAGHCRWVRATTDKKTRYGVHRPWISNKGPVGTLNGNYASPFVGEPAHFTEQGDEVLTAVTNGAIWFAAGSAFEIYRCPVHAREFEKENGGRQPWWSYMMNQEFGYDRDGKGLASCGMAKINDLITVSRDPSGKRGRGHEVSRGHDKVLLFAEVQGIEVNDNKHGVSLKAVTAGDKTDAVLEYTKEEMGFNHKIGKQRWGGNVAFADGHVDTIMMPTDSSYIKDLTRFLCQGVDVPHDGSRYTLRDIDK